MHGSQAKLRRANATIETCVSNFEPGEIQDIEREAVEVVNAVREMIWNDPSTRSVYERFRARGLSADDAVTEIALRHIECLWELSQSNSAEHT